MALPQDGQNANGLTKVTEIPKGKELIFIDPTTNEGGIITLEDLTIQILKKLTSQTFALDQGNMTLLAALNQLNSNPFLRYSKTYGKSLTIENVRMATHGIILIESSIIPFYIGGSTAIGYRVYTGQLPENISISNTDEKTLVIETTTALMITCIYART